MTEETIIKWAEEHKTRNGKYPAVQSGDVSGHPNESWAAINAALQRGFRGLPGNSSLAMLLAEKCGLRRQNHVPDLSADQICQWMEAYHKRTGKWPRDRSVAVEEAPGETWSALDQALRLGTRGLPGGSSLAKLRQERLGVRNHMDLPHLTIDQILAWVDAHKARTGSWPGQKSWQVASTDETWSGIDVALCSGARGLPGGSSLAQLLAEYRGARNRMNLPRLTIDQILAWADAHNAATGDWPSKNFGQVTDTDETWARINAALNRGNRGLPGGSSLAKLLAKYRAPLGPNGRSPSA